MKIVIATPLYPPDLAEPAIYVKELAARLRTLHDVTVVTYAYIPKKIEGVHIVTTSKQRPLFVRLLFYTFSLLRASRGADILYAQSGSSVGLPAIIVHFLRRIPLIVHVIEDEAWKRAVEEKRTQKTLGGFLMQPEGTFKIRFISRLQRSLLCHASSVVVDDKTMRDAIVESYRLEQSRIKSIPEPHPRPEILPFVPFPKTALDAYNISWDEHTQALEQTLKQHEKH